MAIRNIHVLTEQGVNRMALQAQAALREKLVAEHRRGEHPYGLMRRECPLCRAAK